MLDQVQQEAGVTMPTKPARTYVAKAIPHPNGGFVAQFAFPGVVPLYVTSRGTPVLYKEEDEAEKSAALAVVKALSSRYKDRSQSPPERYRRMTGPELAVAIAEANMTPTFFAFIWGTSIERLLEYIDGVPDRQGQPKAVPHAMRILAAIFKEIPQAIDVAERVTEEVTTERKPRRDTGALRPGDG